MPSHLLRRVRTHPRGSQLAGWLVLPAVSAAYVWARLAVSPAANVVRVIAFMVPVLLATIGAVVCWTSAEEGSVARRMWGGVSVAMACILVSEAYYGIYQLAVDMSGPPVPSVFDALNLAAAVAFFGAIASITRLRLEASMVRAQILATAAVFIVSVYAASFRWLTEPLAESAGHSAQEAAVWALYPTLGVLLLAGCVWGVVKHRGVPWVAWQSLVVVSFGAFALAVTMWPVRLIGEAPAQVSIADVLLGVGYVLGYQLFFMSSIYWLTTEPARWTVHEPRANRRQAVSGGWLAVPTFAIVAVAALALAGYRADPNSFERAFYFGALAVTTIAVVVRTTLADAESMGLRARATSDPLTAVWNRSKFESRLREAVASAEADAEGLSLVVVDIDDFARFNVVHGRERGDEVLVHVAQALWQHAGEDATVARLSGDEFAVIVEGLMPAAAHARMRRWLDDTEAAPVAGSEHITLSAGMASWPADGADAETLLASADAALYWAKYQGKHRLQAYDQAVERALDAAERTRAVAEKSKGDIVRALAAATDARDVATAYHSRQVATLAFLVAEAAGLSSERVRDVQMAALLHDVGKVAVPDSVLRKRSRLSPGERAVLKEHAELGARILTGTELAYMAPWVRSHHERWDGSGYPDGTRGPAIPLESRIIAACDVYDRMLSGDAERDPLSRPAALQELDQSMGRSLDPDVAELLIEIVSKESYVGLPGVWTS